MNTCSCTQDLIIAGPRSREAMYKLLVRGTQFMGSPGFPLLILSICKNSLPSMKHTYTAQISRVWTPPIFSAHSSHPPLWHQTWVTAVKYLWIFCCISVALQRSTLWVTRGTTVNWIAPYVACTYHESITIKLSCSLLSIKTSAALISRHKNICCWCIKGMQ